MRMIPVDERMSRWERDDPRYRLYLFEGPGFDTTTLDVVDAPSIERVLDDASRLAEDARLWALALVERDDLGAQGLIWLSGMDYHDAPRSQTEWRRRGEMQDRLLSARSLAGKSLVLPNGLRVLRMFPEWVPGLPLWESFSDAYRVGREDLPLSRELGDALHAWNDAWCDRDPEEPLADEETWVAEGLRLHAEVQRALAGVAEVRREFGP